MNNENNVEVIHLPTEKNYEKYWLKTFDKFCCDFHETITISDSNISGNPSTIKNLCHFFMQQNSISFQSFNVKTLQTLKLMNADFSEYSSASNLELKTNEETSDSNNILLMLSRMICATKDSLPIQSSLNIFQMLNCNLTNNNIKYFVNEINTELNRNQNQSSFLMLQELSFSGNEQISDESVSVLLFDLISNHCPLLMTLELENTSVTDVSCEYFVKYFMQLNENECDLNSNQKRNDSKCAQKLKYINLRENAKLTNKGIAILHQICNMNMNVKQFIRFYVQRECNGLNSTNVDIIESNIHKSCCVNFVDGFLE